MIILIHLCVNIHIFCLLLCANVWALRGVEVVASASHNIIYLSPHALYHIPYFDPNTKTEETRKCFEYERVAESGFLTGLGRLWKWKAYCVRYEVKRTCSGHAAPENWIFRDPNFFPWIEEFAERREVIRQRTVTLEVNFVSYFLPHAWEALTRDEFASWALTTLRMTLLRLQHAKLPQIGREYCECDDTARIMIERIKCH